MRYNAQVFYNLWCILDNLTNQISTTLKSLRKANGWSLDIASQKTGVSKAMLGQIERGESSPTIATLWKIVTGFNVSFSSFIDVSEQVKKQNHPSQDFKQIHPNDDKILIMPLFAYDKILGFEMFIIELLPECEHLSIPHQIGVIEHIVVVSGEIEVLINDNWHHLNQQEGIRFMADKPHGYRNKSNVNAIFHNIIHYTGITI